MPHIRANDGAELFYHSFGLPTTAPLILLHGFTGSGEVFNRNVNVFAQRYQVIVPDLRGHGRSEKSRAGFHVARLAMDLDNLIDFLQLPKGRIAAIGTSLGAAILWSYSELFSTQAFSRLIFVDQAPLQNYLSDWGPEFGNRGCNSAKALEQLQQQLERDPKSAHLATISACLGYRSDPVPGDPSPESKAWQQDEAFFLEQALKGDGWWYGKLMADHTANDWRHAIARSFGPDSRSETKVLVVASSRSGCFPAAGPLKVVDLINSESGKGLANGVCIDWGGHWCYWEKPELFNTLVLEFLS